MKQVPRIPTLQCETHPASTISSVQVEQKCPYKSRLACMKCLIDYKSLDNFIDISDFVSTESVITSCLNLKGFNNQIGQYLLQSQQQYTQIIDNFIQQLHNKVDALKDNMMQQLDNWKEYLMKTAELRIQYDAELTMLQNKIQSVSQLTNYHKTNDWAELKECVESYVQLLYQPENQEIKVTLLGINAQRDKRFDLQPIQQCKDSIAAELDNLCKHLPITILFTQTILDCSTFGNSIIDRITDKRKKQMKLLFSGQSNGMNAAAFWKHCLNMGSTITICETQTGQIVGGYTPCKWINTGGFHQDASMTSFIFSVTKQQIYPLKNKEQAIFGYNGYGPVFGDGNDLYIATDFQTHSNHLGTHYDTSQYQIADPKTHLLGAASPTKLKSIEVYLIE